MRIGERTTGRLLVASAGLLLTLMVSGAAGPATVQGQSPQEAHLDQLAKMGRDLAERLGPEGIKTLSSGGQHLLAVTENVEELKEATKRFPPVRQERAAAQQALPRGFGNDPFAGEDLLTRFSGMTQSETTVGWCASNALIGFNDSGSFVDTLFLAASPSGSLSFNGWSRSTNAGRSYTDMGALIADPLPPGIMFRDLGGDPVIGCTGSSTFYYASLAFDTGADFAFFQSGISVSRSTDGGASFGPAVMAASEDAQFHFLDKPWMAVDPGPTASADDDVIHVVYTDFDDSGFAEPPSGPCPGDSRTAIEHVRSTDGGATWSPPLVIEEVCGGELGSFVQGSQVEVGIDDDVYVAWEHYESFETGRDIRIATSTNGGQGFGSPQVVAPVTPIGDSFALQGNFRAFLDLQGLAVDRSTRASRGAVYISWHDGSNRSKVDPFGNCGGEPAYCFADILATRSVDGGATWSEPVRVNDDAITLGIDQFMPALEVDHSGDVWVAFYDRRRDVRNLLIDTFVARSRNGGLGWTNRRVTRNNFAPVTGWQDIVVNPFYMGDYIAVAVDVTGTFRDVILAWGDNSLGDANVLQDRR